MTEYREGPIGASVAAQLLGTTREQVIEACQAGVLEHKKFGRLYVLDYHTVVGYDRKGWPKHAFKWPGVRRTPRWCRWCSQAPDAAVHQT